jgi:hypothetical protein
MDFYDYDPSLYYASEDDTSSSAEPKIQFEFGASASLSISASIGATHSTAQAQTVGGEHPPLDVNTQAKLWMGMAVTIFIVTVRIEALRPVLLGICAFSSIPLFTLDVHGRGGLEAAPNGQHPGRGSRHQWGRRGRSRRQRGRRRHIQRGLPPRRRRCLKFACPAAQT